MAASLGKHSLTNPKFYIRSLSINSQLHSFLLFKNNAASLIRLSDCVRARTVSYLFVGLSSEHTGLGTHMSSIG